MNYKSMVRSVKDYIRLPFCYNHWYVAGLIEEFGQEPTAKTLLERSIVFYRTEAGELVAMQNRCLHRSFPLSNGFREGDNLVCRYHGIRYTPNGTIAKVPCQEHVPNRKLHVYPIKEVGPFAFIWMGNPEQPDWDAFPDLSFLEDSGHRTMHEALHIEGNYLLMHENLNDLTHFAYLHKDSFRIGDFFFDLPTTVEKTETGVLCNRIDTNPERAIAALPPQAQAQAAGKPVERHDGGMCLSPGVFKGYAPIHVGAEDDPDRTTYGQYILHYLTPETATTTHYYWSVTNDFHIDDDEYYGFMQGNLSKGFAEDKWACAEMQQLLDDDKIDYKEMVIAGDKAGMLFRGVMLDWVLAEYVDAG